MTFSEFILKFSRSDYLEYCKQNSTPPVFDTDPKPNKVCALCKPVQNKPVAQAKDD
jgi:hypothetical protein